MSTFTKRRRVAVAAVGLAVAISPLMTGAITAASNATPARSAATAVDNTYLQDTFAGLPAQTVVETVTYDRFQWLLQQPGQFAFLIGSPSDSGFAAKVVQADAAAKAAGAAKIYWFDPNLSGQSGTKNLDTRNPGDISSIAASSQAIYGRAWQNILGQYLGNGLKSTVSAVNSESATVATVADDTVVNDATNPLFDYRSTATVAPVGTHDDLFFIYDKDHTDGGNADKIVSGVDLTTDADTATDIATAFTTTGGSNIDQLSQFAWWKSEVNAKHNAQAHDATSPTRYGTSVLDDADNADGWAVKQITYPELLHLLDVKDSADKNFVILFGGTWCPNTRAVIKDVNKQAQDNNVTVYNFDTVLDGGTVGGGTTSNSNPIQIRNNAYSGTTTNFVPSYLYGDLVRTYLKNIVTEYEPNTGTRVSYFPGGDTSKFPDVVRKLQVPFLVNYQRGTSTSPSSSSIKRQWIQQNLDASTGLPTFTEYMTQYWYTHPEGTRIGLSATQLPLSLPIPADAENAPDNAFLTPAEQALDASAQAPLLAQRRNSVAQAEAGVAFARDGLDALDTFFGGLAGAVVSTQTVTAPSVAYGTAPTVTLAIANKYGRVPAGTATLAVAGHSYPVTIAQNAAVFTVDKLAAGSYPYTISYPGGDQIVAFQKTGTLTVSHGAVRSVSFKVTTKPTSKKTGKATVTVAPHTGLSTPSGTVTVSLKRGSSTKTVTGTLSKGAKSVTLPKLSKGTWKVKVTYNGNANYSKLTKSYTLKVTK